MRTKRHILGAPVHFLSFGYSFQNVQVRTTHEMPDHHRLLVGPSFFTWFECKRDQVLMPSPGELSLENRPDPEANRMFHAAARNMRSRKAKIEFQGADLWERLKEVEKALVCAFGYDLEVLKGEARQIRNANPRVIVTGTEIGTIETLADKYLGGQLDFDLHS